MMSDERDMDHIIRLGNAARNQIIQELIEKADAEAKGVANKRDIPLGATLQSQIAWWLKSQMEGG